MTPPSCRAFAVGGWVRLIGCLARCLIGCLASCSGSSGGTTEPTKTPESPPVVVAATLISTGAIPAAGDTLQLVMSEDVEVTAGKLLTDADVTLSQGTLGTVTVSPALKNPRTVQLTLASGVSLAAGATITFSAANNSIFDLTGNQAIPGTPVAIKAGDGDDPSISVLSLSEVDSTLDGTGAAGGTLQVPTNGFTIDVSHGDASSDLDLPATIIVANVAVSVVGAERLAGRNLSDALTRTTDGQTTTFTVPSTVVFPTGSFKLTVYVLDSTGMISAPRSFTGLARQPDDAVRPFETTVNASQVWFIDTSRDIETYTLNIFNFVSALQITAGANGRSDLEDLFLELGLLSATPIANVSGSKSSNEVTMDRFRAAVLAELNMLFDGANVTFTFDAPGAWVGGSSVPYNSLGFSKIALSGAEDPSGTTGTLGVAIFDPSNSTQDDNTLLAYNGSQRLGVFLHTICNDGVIAHPTTLFRVTFDPFTTARWGLPIGNDFADGARLLRVTIDGRTTAIDNAINRMARFSAVILAHECGHSVGLVMNGAMPVGLYGAAPASFPVFPSSAADGHIKMPANLFPGLAENIMSPAFDFDSALAPETQFNSLNRAYLRERVLANGN